jgi:hypothetical protein
VAYGVKMRDDVNVIIETVTCESRANIVVRRVRDAPGLGSVVSCE